MTCAVISVLTVTHGSVEPSLTLQGEHKCEHCVTLVSSEREGVGGNRLPRLSWTGCVGCLKHLNCVPTILLQGRNKYLNHTLNGVQTIVL